LAVLGFPILNILNLAWIDSHTLGSNYMTQKFQLILPKFAFAEIGIKAMFTKFFKD
jgi:hypothetical protein